jgi:hypothetical protein
MAKKIGQRIPGILRYLQNFLVSLIHLHYPDRLLKRSRGGRFLTREQKHSAQKNGNHASLYQNANNFSMNSGDGAGQKHLLLPIP